MKVECFEITRVLVGLDQEVLFAYKFRPPLTIGRIKGLVPDVIVLRGPLADQFELGGLYSLNIEP